MAERLNAAKFSIGINTVLVLLKAFVALITGSVAVLAEVFHSLFDLIASLLAYVGIEKAMMPPDKTHHYGHYRFENLSSLAQVLLILLTAALVAFEALRRLEVPSEVKQTEVGIALILFSLLAATYTSRRLRKVAEKEKSAALESDAYHFTTDIWSGVSVLVGLVLVALGFPMGDPLAALVVAALMLYGSTSLAKKSIAILSDSAPDSEKIETVEKIIGRDKRILSFHNLRGRQSGSRIFLDVHIDLRPDTHLKVAHRIAHEIKSRIMRALPDVEDVHIHLEPERKG